MTDASLDDLRTRKAALRAQALARRDELEIDDRLEWDVAITQGVLAVYDDVLADAARWGLADGAVGPVSAYWPMRSEADPRPVLEVLHGRGVELCLPAIVAKRMIFRRWAPYEPLVPGGFGTLVPDPAQPEIAPRILIVPMAAFDGRCHRIGYGAGYYDSALAQLPGAVTIGIAYAAQQVEAVPDEAHDRQLDFIVSERETFAGSHRRG
jgi:5-formyltetrahydrofolate cyclo-ligase